MKNGFDLDQPAENLSYMIRKNSGSIKKSVNNNNNNNSNHQINVANASKTFSQNMSQDLRNGKNRKNIISYDFLWLLLFSFLSEESNRSNDSLRDIANGLHSKYLNLLQQAENISKQIHEKKGENSKLESEIELLKNARRY
jgi:gas vesicle protein